MLGRIKRFISSASPSSHLKQGGAGSDLAHAAQILDTVPQFPPYPRGFPAIDPAAILERQNELLIKIRDMLGFTLKEHQEIVEPILLRYAAYVHLLPASQIHHHRGAGGLLRHGLEVAFWAGQSAKAMVFPFDGAPRYKHEHRARWRLAFFLAGLTHDVGKPVMDMQIIDPSGEHIWDPYGPSLMDWCASHQLERYYIRWVASRRHKQHESGGLLIANRIVGRKTISYLSAFDNTLMPSLTQVMSGQGQPGERLMSVVMEADRHSVMLDMKANRLEVNGYSHGIPVEQHVIEVVRKLVTQKAWKVNTPDAMVWHLQQGVFIRWDEAVKDINRMVVQLDIPAIPKDAHALADILIERGIASQYESVTADGEVLSYRYHRLSALDNQHDDDDRYILALRLVHADYVFETVAPPLWHGGMAVHDQHGKAQTQTVTPEAATSVTAAPALNDAIPKPAPSPDPDTDAPPQDSGIAQHIDPTKLDLQTKPSVQTVPLDVDSLIDAMVQREGPTPPMPKAPTLETVGDNGNTDETPADTDDQDTGASEDKEAALAPADNGQKEQQKVSRPLAQPRGESGPAIVLNQQPAQERAAPLKGRSATYSTHISLSSSDNAGPSLTAQTVIADTAVERLEQTLESHGQAGRYLSQILQPIIADEGALGLHVRRAAGVMVLTYPDALTEIGDPAQVMSELANAGMLVSDALFANKKIHDVDGQRVLKLVPALSKAIEEALKEIELRTDPFGQPGGPDVEADSTQNAPPSTLASDEPSVRCDENASSTKQAQGKSPAPDQNELFYQNDSLNVATQQRPSPSLEPDASSDRRDQTLSLEGQAHTVPAQQNKPAAPSNTPSKQRKGKSRVAPISGPPNVTPDEILKELKAMMLEGKGRWLTEPVTRQGAFLVVPELAVVKSIVLEYPSRISTTKMRMALSTNSHGFSILHKQIRLLIGEPS